MRRFAAIVVLLVFGCVTAAPLLALSSDRGDNRPACCRRGGAHHCDMAAPDETPVAQLSTRCPCFPRAATVLVTRGHAAPAGSASIYAEIVSHPAIHAQTQALSRISFDRNRHKRGPPAIL
jgi:hypothetical protein